MNSVLFINATIGFSENLFLVSWSCLFFKFMIKKSLNLTVHQAQGLNHLSINSRLLLISASIFPFSILHLFYSRPFLCKSLPHSQSWGTTVLLPDLHEFHFISFHINIRRMKLA